MGMILELGLGVVLGIAVALFWGIVEPVLTPAAVARSTAWGLVVLVAWVVGVALWERHENRQRVLRNRLRQIDWGGG